MNARDKRRAQKRKAERATVAVRRMFGPTCQPSRWMIESVDARTHHGRDSATERKGDAK